jgi:hypothetical protein
VRRAIFQSSAIRTSQTSSVDSVSHQVTNTRAQRPTMPIDMRKGTSPGLALHGTDPSGGAALVQAGSPLGAPRSSPP